MLISAFTCGPGGGSEPGAGWAWALAASRENDVWVLTQSAGMSASQLEETRRATSAATAHRLTFTFLDAPRWIRRWFRGGLGLRLSYLVWQRRARQAARRLDDQVGFDVVHHVTFANIWLPTGVDQLEAPFVLGPVGGGPRIPFRMWPELGLRGMVTESLRIAAQVVSRFNPAVRRSWQRARVILVQNLETLNSLPRAHRSKCRIRHHATIVAPIGGGTADDVPRVSTAVRDGKVAIYAGRLVAWKGPGMAVRALAGLPDWHLLVVGSGPELPRLRTLVHRLEIADRVEFISWTPREELHRLMRGAHVQVVPSLRDDSPFIVAEAQALGLPVAGYEQGGLATFAGLAGTCVELADLTGSRRDAVEGLRAAIARAAEARIAPSETSFSIEGIADDLRGIYGTARSADTEHSSMRHARHLRRAPGEPADTSLP